MGHRQIWLASRRMQSSENVFLSMNQCEADFVWNGRNSKGAVLYSQWSECVCKARLLGKKQNQSLGKAGRILAQQPFLWEHWLLFKSEIEATTQLLFKDGEQFL